MSKPVLIVVGLLLILMGAAGLIPSWTLATEPSWHAVFKIVVGVIAVAVASMDKGKASTE